MVNMKHDRNGVRTPVDVERRHKLGLIEKTASEVEEIKEIDATFSSTSTRAVQNKTITTAVNRLFNEKVNKVEGMGLSHNDYTDNDKYKVNNLDGHTHNNIEILNSITSQDIANWNATSFESYSTSEEVIGEWIDGKPLYRKVLNFNTSTTIDSFVQISGIGNINSLVKYSGYIIQSNSQKFLLPFTAYDTNSNFTRTIWFCTQSDGNLYEAHSHSAQSDKECYLIVEYTKTTD